MKHSLGNKEVKELVKVVVSAKDDAVVGFHMVGSEASEILQVLVQAPSACVGLLGPHCLWSRALKTLHVRCAHFSALCSLSRML